MATPKEKETIKKTKNRQATVQVEEPVQEIVVEETQHIQEYIAEEGNEIPTLSIQEFDVFQFVTYMLFKLHEGKSYKQAMIDSYNMARNPIFKEFLQKGVNGRFERPCREVLVQEYHYEGRYGNELFMMFMEALEVSYKDQEKAKDYMMEMYTNFTYGIFNH